MAIIDGTAGNDFFRFLDNPLGGDDFNMGAGNDFVFANTGPDNYMGGTGFDTVSYYYAAEGVTLNLSSGGSGGMASGHIYSSIERIFGSNFDDDITGSAAVDYLYGGAGRDILNGEGGNDRIFGGDGSDTIDGGAGNDYIEGGAGGDFINGGAGIDTVGFTTAKEGVFADLNAPPPQAEPLESITSNDGLSDFYVNVENISGSFFDDTLLGSDSANNIRGRSGDDRLVGRDGDDALFGGLGDDSLFGDEGNDRFYLGDGEDYAEGGDGNDFFYLTNDGEIDEIYGGNNTNGDGPNTDTGYDTVSYIQATAGVEIYLGGLIIVGPFTPVGAEPLDTPLNMTVVEQDFLIGIERIIGSNFDDAIFGGFGDETIFGGNGNDVLEGGAGRDRLFGGSGADDFGFFIGGSDTDAILDFVNGVDTITFFTTNEGLTKSDILATIVDYETHFVFEFGFGDGPVEQRLSIIKNDPDQGLSMDDFTIEILSDSPFGPPARETQQPLAEDFDSYDFTQNPAAFFDADALI